MSPTLAGGFNVLLLIAHMPKFCLILMVCFFHKMCSWAMGSMGCTVDNSSGIPKGSPCRTKKSAGVESQLNTAHGQGKSCNCNPAHSYSQSGVLNGGWRHRLGGRGGVWGFGPHQDAG